MRALSLTQPWASLMAFGEKHYETRDWATQLRGEIAIVASKGFPAACRKACHASPMREVLAEHGITIVGLTPSKPNQLPLSAVLAVVELVEVVPTNPAEHLRRLSRPPVVSPARHEASFGDYGPDRFAWVTTNLRRLERPVPVERLEGGVAKQGGALGLYNLSPECVAAVRAQLR